MVSYCVCLCVCVLCVCAVICLWHFVLLHNITCITWTSVLCVVLLQCDVVCLLSRTPPYLLLLHLHRLLHSIHFYLIKYSFQYFHFVYFFSGRKSLVFYLHNKGGCCARDRGNPGKLRLNTANFCFFLPAPASSLILRGDIF